jgi:cytochrome P450
MLDYDLWKSTRHLINPAFKLSYCKKIGQHFENCTNLFLKNIEKFGSSGKPFDVKIHFEAFILDMVLGTLFSAEVDSANDTLHPIVVNSRRIFQKDITLEQLTALFSPKLSKIFDFRAVDRLGVDYIVKFIQAIINERKRKNSKSHDILQYLLNNSNESGASSEFSELEKFIIAISYFWK